MTPQVGSIIANRFELVRELGHGSMGTVWLAQHLTLDLRCAVKFMTAEATRDPNYMARFELEARAIAQLQSPNVVRVLDYEVTEGVPFIAMELLNGEDLGARLKRVGRLDAGTTHRIVAQIARGLTRAHAAGIVHRDLKPENVFLAQEDDDEIAKLLDFGIAKLALPDGVDGSTQVGSVLGTPVYMSPEQARGVRSVDHRSDLWSLAVITYECLTGKLPFDGTSLGDVFARIMFEPIPVPSLIAPHLPPAFDRWWERAVSRDVDERFSCAREFSDELARALDLADPAFSSRSSRPELASVQSVDPVALALPRRRRSGTTATILVAAAILGGVAVTHARIEEHMGNGPMAMRARSAARAVEGLLTSAVPVASAAAEQPAPSPALAAPARAPSPQFPSLTAVVHPRPVSVLAPAAAPLPDVDRAVRIAAVSPSPPAPSAARAPDPVVVASAPTGVECTNGQRRCQGSILQLCNDAHDGWSDVVDCGGEATCDATGSGRCATLPSGATSRPAAPRAAAAAPPPAPPPVPGEEITYVP